MTTVIEGAQGPPAPDEPHPPQAMPRTHADLGGRRPLPRPGPAAAPPWSVGPARPADRPALATLFGACSEETVRLRFFGRVREWPRAYLDSALGGRPEEHDAVVAYGTGGIGGAGRADLLGLASLATPSEAGPGIGELGVLVADAWQRQGVGTAMIDLLLSRARARGMERVAASVLPGRSELLASLTRRLEPVGHLRSRDGLTGVYKLTRPGGLVLA
jgi:GNAT superfamily N-acetyltransferase